MQVLIEYNIMSSSIAAHQNKIVLSSIVLLLILAESSTSAANAIMYTEGENDGTNNGHRQSSLYFTKDAIRLPPSSTSPKSNSNNNKSNTYIQYPQGNKIEGKIIGGSDVINSSYEYPWFARPIGQNSDWLGCGGSLVRIYRPLRHTRRMKHIGFISHNTRFHSFTFPCIRCHLSMVRIYRLFDICTDRNTYHSITLNIFSFSSFTFPCII